MWLLVDHVDSTSDWWGAIWSWVRCGRMPKYLRFCSHTFKPNQYLTFTCQVSCTDIIHERSWVPQSVFSGPMLWRWVGFNILSAAILRRQSWLFFCRCRRRSNFVKSSGPSFSFDQSEAASWGRQRCSARRATPSRNTWGAFVLWESLEGRTPLCRRHHNLLCRQRWGSQFIASLWYPRNL